MIGYRIEQHVGFTLLTLLVGALVIALLSLLIMQAMPNGPLAKRHAEAARRRNID